MKITILSKKYSLIACFALCFSLYNILFAEDNNPKIIVNPLGHSGKVYELLFTKNGNKIITISDDKSIRIWDASTGEMLRTLYSQVGNGPEGMLYCAAMSKKSDIIAVSGYPVSSQEENYIVFIDPESEKQIGVARGHKNVITTVDFSHDGKYLASGSDDGTVIIWDLANMNDIKALSTIYMNSTITSLSFAANTISLAVATRDKNVKILDLSLVKRDLKNYPFTQLKKHKDVVTKIKFSPDGQHLVTSGLDNKVLLWKANGDYVTEIDKYDNHINTISFSLDGKVLVTLEDISGKGSSYSIPSGSKFSTFDGHNNTAFAAQFSPRSAEGNYLVASSGGNNNEILIWNAISGATQQKISGDGSIIWDLAFGQGLDLFISKKTVIDRKENTYEQSFNFQTFISKDYKDPMFVRKHKSEDIKQLGLYTLLIPKGKLLKNDPAIDGKILCHQITYDEKIIVGSDFSLKIYDITGLLLKEFVGHVGGVRALSISKDGRYLASGGEDQSIKLWKLSESGTINTISEIFYEDNWQVVFQELGLDSLIHVPNKTAWKQATEALAKNGVKEYKELEYASGRLIEAVPPFASLFVANNMEWICWSPYGYFNSSSQGGEYFGWQINNGIDQLADFYNAEQFTEILYRPDLVRECIKDSTRVYDLLVKKGERIFDLTKLKRPSAVVLETSKLLLKESHQVTYDHGKYTTNKKTFEITVDLYDGGGGLKALQVYQNEKLVLIDDQIEKQKQKTYTLNLINGKNDFKFIVINYQKIESRPELITIHYTGELMATSNLYVLAIGINKYKNTKYNLNYAQPDAYSFINTVNYRSNHIFKSVKTYELYNEKATKSAILATFDVISKIAQPEDVFVFYYAGHGTIDEEHDNEYYFVPHDVTQLYGDIKQLKNKAVSSDELKVLLSTVPSQKQFILMDACHSGGVVKSFDTRSAGAEEKAIFQLARSAGVVLIASSGTQQFAIEFDALRHGAFTYALLEGMNGKADGGTKDKKITVNELKTFMEDRVPEITKKHGGKAQYPTGFVHGQDFPISIIY